MGRIRPAFHDREDLLRAPAQVAGAVRKQREIEADQRAAGLDHLVGRVEAHPEKLPGGRPFRDSARAGGGREAVEDIAAAGLEPPPEPREQPAAHGVEHHVRTTAEGSVDELLRRAVQAGRGGAELAAQRELRFGPDERHRGRAPLAKKLQQGRPDSAGRGGDHDAVSGRHLRAMTRVPGGEKRDRDGRGLDRDPCPRAGETRAPRARRLSRHGRRRSEARRRTAPATSPATFGPIASIVPEISMPGTNGGFGVLG